jgi:aldehyde dehydrogenase (NAD+)
MTPTITPGGAVDEIIGQARAVQSQWERTPVARRLRPVRTFRRLLVAECDALCAAANRDLGKPPDETIGGDLLPLADALQFLERQANRILRPRRVPRSQRPLWLWGQSDVVRRRAYGVVAIIGTWNYPYLLNGVQIAQALTAGNAVLWKPSEVGPASARMLGQLFARAGFPSELLHVLEATRAAGQAVTEAAVDHVVFTGSAATGHRIAARLGERLIPSTLELSGCDAMFVLDDADVDLAARAAWFGATLNGGQTCLAVRRAFVHRSLYADFCARLEASAREARPVRLALPAQAEQAKRLAREAVSEGGRVLGAAPAEEDNGDAGMFRPVAVADARPEMALCREASFAPVLAVLPFDTADEVLRMDAACSFALGASVFTRSPKRTADLVAHLRVGMVTVNDVVVPTAHPATPFGGRGESGWGVTQGEEGLLAVTVPQVVSIRAGRFRPHFDLAAKGGKLRALLESGHAATVGQRLRGWWRLLWAAWRGSL